MPVLILKSLDCELTHSLTVDFTKLKISADGEELDPIKNTFNNRERKLLSNEIQFNTSVDVKLITAGTIKLGSTLTIKPAALPHKASNGLRGLHRGIKSFKEAAAKYSLWYEVVPDGMTAKEFHAEALPSTISLRETFGRTGWGALTEYEQNKILPKKKYLCSEVISLPDIFALHGPQDGQKSNATSLREWIANHCNIWGEESVIPINQVPDPPLAISLASNPQWRPVKDESSRVLAGFVTASELTDSDNPFTHMSLDYHFDIMPTPAFNYLLAYTARTIDIENPNDNADNKFAQVQIPRSHNEWESGSMPLEWRPEVGDYVTIWGRHVFDLGHLPMTTEMHPPHTIVREFTLEGGKLNRAVIGMGFSGGLPGSVKAELSGELEERWNAEFGGYPSALSIRDRRCWPTNLKKHPLKIKLFPPEARPGPDAVLQASVSDWRMIRVSSNLLDNFIERCKGKTKKLEKINRSFNDWYPEHLEVKPAAFKPKLISRDTYFDLEIDLSSAEDIPVAYHAVVTCGWSGA